MRRVLTALAATLGLAAAAQADTTVKLLEVLSSP